MENFPPKYFPVSPMNMAWYWSDASLVRIYETYLQIRPKTVTRRRKRKETKQAIANESLFIKERIKT